MARPSAGRLADALASGAHGNVRPLLVDFDRATLVTRKLSVQKAQIAAIRSCDAQTRRLSTLSADVVRERLRLVSSLRERRRSGAWALPGAVNI